MILCDNNDNSVITVISKNLGKDYMVKVAVTGFKDKRIDVKIFKLRFVHKTYCILLLLLGLKSSSKIKVAMHFLFIYLFFIEKGKKKKSKVVPKYSFISLPCEPI